MPPGHLFLLNKGVHEHDVNGYVAVITQSLKRRSECVHAGVVLGDCDYRNAGFMESPHHLADVIPLNNGV